ncbi:MAG: hypothetical protein FWH18_10175 [Marinilabiliaceae bacterium]|nr:hypothetical protein [Marinilabiliaceae bacterium]
MGRYVNKTLIRVDQSILGRILNYGTVRIVGTGGTLKSFEKIRKPLEFRRKFQEVTL